MIYGHWLRETCAILLAFTLLAQDPFAFAYALPVKGYGQVVWTRSRAHSRVAVFDVNWVLVCALRKTVLGVGVLLERRVWAFLYALLLVNEARAFALCDTDLRVFQALNLVFGAFFLAHVILTVSV